MRWLLFLLLLHLQRHSMIIEANEQEIAALQMMLHRACLQGGLQVAQAAAHWNMKLTMVMQASGKANGHGDSIPGVGISEETRISN